MGSATCTAEAILPVSAKAAVVGMVVAAAAAGATTSAAIAAFV